VLKASGIGLLALAGASATSTPVAAHEKIGTPATDLLGPIQVPANSDAGFNYPYYLYVPETTQEAPVPMLVEPNNTGLPSDDLGDHRSAVEDRLADGLGPQLYSKALVVPLLVPVFPRPAGEIAPSGTYTHALDEDSMELDRTDLERVDRQLLRMIEHARGLLDGLSYPVAEDVLLNGFSASGNFVNRFAALHPERVRSLSAGGINGTPILPLERAKGHELDYPIGITDLEELTGKPFDATRWREVAQFLYLGGEDENDTIPYDDAWSDRHQRVAVDVYGEDMQEDRMPYSERVYDEAGADATFRVYDGVGHTAAPLQIQQDIASFHRRNARLKQLSFTERPQVGDTTVQFDTAIYDEQSYRLRVRSTERGDITETPAPVTTNEEATSAVSLSSAVASEGIVGVVLPAGTTDPESAVASVRAVVKELPLVEIVDAPTGTQPTIAIEYGVNSSHRTSSPIHLFVRDTDNGRSLLTTFDPGPIETETFDLSSGELDVTVEEGTELSVELVDIDDDSTLSSTSVVIGDTDGNEESESETGTVAFATQPTDGRDRLDIRYSVEDGYEPNAALTLQGHIGADTDVLLGAPVVGEEVTETVSVEQIPMAAGTDIAVEVVGEQILDTDRTVVFRDTDGAVTVGYTSPPTGDDRSATVEYSVSDSYEVADALTLRVYDETLYGSDPGDAIALLSPGDTGAVTFTLGEDTDANVDDPVVAVVDDVPLARATTQDIGAERATDETGPDSATERETDETGRDSATERETDETDQDSATERGGSQEGQQTTSNEPSGEKPEESRDDRDDDTTGAGGPGFGVGSAIVSVGSLGYLLKRRFDDD